MNPAPTFDRTYPLIKQQVLWGNSRPGERIDVGALSKDLDVSAIPVREVLQRLVGERVLELVPGGGFALPELSEEALRNLYVWHGQLVRIALRHQGTLTPRPPSAALLDALARDDHEGFAFATEAVFAAIANASMISEHAIVLTSVGERLRRFRRREARLIKDLLPELHLVRTLTEIGPEDELREAISAYHRRRLRRVAQLVTVSNAL